MITHDARIRTPGGFACAPVVVRDTILNLGVTRNGPDIAGEEIHVEGVSLGDAGTEARTEITTGDKLQLGLGATSDSIAPVEDTIYYMGAWLQGVVLTSAGTLNYLNNPCALIAAYGPGGSVVPDALRWLSLGDFTADLALGQTIVNTGGAVVAGPSGYPTACDAGSGLHFRRRRAA